ncbi:lyase family protein [Jiangella endophytica]|uniref:lyase family protein n=1 Tax=Jiangella endophytica TaxID=1623398 RepID=UPI000E34B3B8|nr:lyase family protein [Jiangella endophytica]
MADLLVPGAHRARGLLDDAALVRAMLSVEVAWSRALSETGGATAAQAAAVERAAAGWSPLLDPGDVEDAGNPVLPLVTALRERVADPEVAALVHAGLTSQDVLDSALQLLAGEALGRIRTELGQGAAALARLAREHRSTVMAGRTLTQYAVPVTFGLTAAQWLAAILDAAERLGDVRRSLPVQCGGAAGTLARVSAVVPDPAATAAAFARHLGLRAPALPWHVRRTPVTRLGDALAETCDALGVLAADVLTLGRPEIGEVAEGAVAGRGGSSTMPHKRNPVLAVLVNGTALQAPQLAAQLHLAAARSVDQRPDGAWQAEWPALLRLLEVTVVAAAQSAELVRGLRVHADVMRRRADDAAAHLLAERPGGTGGDPATYLGASEAFVDAVLRRYDEERTDDT